MTSQTWRTIFRNLYDLLINLGSLFSEIYDRFSKTRYFGGLEIFGIEIIQEFEYNLFMPSAGFILLLIGIGIVSLFNPFA